MAHFLAEHDKDELALTRPDTAQWLIADFLTGSKSDYSGPVVLEMGGHLNRIVELFDPRSVHAVVKVVLRAISRQTPGRCRRYDTIWDLDQLLAWLEENWPENGALSPRDLQTKCMLLVMIFSACRLAELARMTRPDVIDLMAPSITIKAVTKQKQSTLQDFVMRRADRPSICPVAALHTWLTRPDQMQNRLLFPSETGRTITVPTIGYQFLKVFARAKIDPHYTAYSVKHAVVTKLYTLGATDEEVCAYGHWAPGSRTPRQWYYIPVVDKNWLGTRLVTSLAESIQRAVLTRPDAQEGAAEPPQPQ
jgi:integrase